MLFLMLNNDYFKASSLVSFILFVDDTKTFEDYTEPKLYNIMSAERIKSLQFSAGNKWS